MKRLVGFDLNGWRDQAMRNWIEKPGEGETFNEGTLISAGIGGIVVTLDDGAREGEHVGGAQARLAPHGRGSGWGEIGTDARRVRVSDLLTNPQQNIRALAAALSGLARESAVGVMAIADTGRDMEHAQEALLDAMRQARTRRRLLVWRPVLAVLASLDLDIMQTVTTVGIVSHDDTGFATQKLIIRRGPITAPERREVGRIHPCDLGLSGLHARAVAALQGALPPGVGAEHLMQSETLIRLALGEPTRREPVRRSGESWHVIDPPKGLVLDRLVPTLAISDHLADCDLILFETPTTGAVRSALATMWIDFFGCPVRTLTNDAVASGALIAAKRLSEGAPVYFDFLPQISTIIQGRDGARTFDLIPKDETLPAGMVYRSREPACFALQPMQDSISVYLRKETEAVPRLALVPLAGPVSHTTPVDLRVEQTPASGRARLTLTSKAFSSPIVVDWDAAEKQTKSWETIIEELKRPRPTIPNRLVLPCGMEVWDGPANRRGLSEVLAANFGRREVDWEALATLAASRPNGKYAVSSDGDVPSGLSLDDETMLDQIIDLAERDVRARLNRPPAPGNLSLQFATWMFRRCPVGLVAPMIDALKAIAGAHPFLHAHQSRTLIYQGLGRSARTSSEFRQIFDHLLSIPTELWKKDQTACAAFLLSRTDEAPTLLLRSEVDRIGLVVSRQLSAAVGGDYTASFIYAPILLVGLLRWRLVDPWALVAGRDPTANTMLEGLDAVIADLAIQSLRIPRLAKHYELLVQSRQELNGEGGNSDLLMDLYSL
jgi:hypothetical protein